VEVSDIVIVTLTVGVNVFEMLGEGDDVIEGVAGGVSDVEGDDVSDIVTVALEEGDCVPEAL